MTPTKQLPRSFTTGGYNLPEQVRLVQGRKNKKRIMIGTDGPANSGKTEFACSAPGPGQVICLDRGFDGMFDNPNPPVTRRSDFGFKVVLLPKAGQARQSDFLDYWREFYKEYLDALANPDSLTVVIDGDSDSWELQRLAEFGKLTQIPSIMYTNVNAARRAMYNRAFDSGKIVIATNKISKDYRPLLNPDGTPQLKDGKEVREWDGKSYSRQGFADQDYLWHLQIRHLYEPAYVNDKRKEVPQQWGIKIMACKANRALVGTELWGDECNFQSLVSVVYPHIPLEDWGY